MIGLEARRIGMGVGAVQSQHRHSFRGGKKIPVVGGEAESIRRGRRHRRSIGDGQKFQKIVPEHRQAVAGSERMHAGRREAETERLPIQRSLRQIADTNDEMIDSAGHGISGLRADRNRRLHRGAKHCCCGPAQENLLQGQRLSVTNWTAMTYILPPLNALRAFEAAARHLSFKLAAHELHVTPAAVGQQVKALEARLGVRLFERLHKQLVLTAAGQAYLPEISDGFRRIADATAQLKPVGAVLLQLGVHGSFDLRRLELEEFRASHAEIGLRVLQPAGLHELIEGKVDVLIARGLGNHPGYRCDRVTEGSGLGDWLIAPAGTADCPEISGFRDWLRGLPAENALALHRRRRLVGIVRS